MDDDTRPITDLLLELRSGDQTALDRLFPLVYQELRGWRICSSGSSARITLWG